MRPITLHPWAKPLADATIAVAAALAAIFTRIYVLTSYQPQVSRAAVNEQFRFFAGALPLSIGVLLTFGWLMGLYRGQATLSAKFRKLALVTGGSACVSATVLYFNQLTLSPRGSLVLFWSFTTLGMLCARLSSHSLRRWFYVEPRNKRWRTENNRVLIVGGAGYLGSVAARELLQRGYEVRVLDNLMFGDESIRELYSHPRFELIRGDFRQVETVVEAVRGIGSVIHLGAIVGDPACDFDHHAALSINLYATKLIHDVCRGFGARRLIFASSCSVYGSSEAVVDEESQTVPVSLYAATKLDSERILLSMADHGFCPVVLRLATVFGASARPRFDLVVNRLTAQAYYERRIRLFNPQQYRPFIHTGDVARAIALFLEADPQAIGGQIFNVGSDTMNYSIGRLGGIIETIVPGTRVEVENVKSDPRNYRVSFEKLRRTLPFAPATDLATGIIGLIELFRSGAITDYRANKYNNRDYLEAAGLSEVADLPVTYSRPFIAARRAVGM